MTVLSIPDMDAKPWPTLGPQVWDWLEKSRRRDPRAIDYGLYWVINPNLADHAWPGQGRPADGFPWAGAGLDQVETYLMGEAVE